MASAFAVIVVSCSSGPSAEDARTGACLHLAAALRLETDDGDGAEEEYAAARRDARDAAERDNAFEEFARAVDGKGVYSFEREADRGLILESCETIWADDLGGTGDA